MKRRLYSNNFISAMNIGSVSVVFCLTVVWFDISSSQRPGRRPRWNQWRNPNFLRNFERRMMNGRPVYSPKAVGLTKRGWGKKNIYNKVNKAFGNCDIPDQDVVKTMFPGLFRSVDELYTLPEMQQNKPKSDKVTETPSIREWRALPSRKIPIPKTVSTTSETVVLQSDQSAVTGSFSRNAFVCDCCKVERFFETYKNVTVGDTTYEVIEIPNEGQFFAIERCPEKPNCQFGGCIQRYTRQPILIWNDTKPYYPPLDFAQFDFPTHCEWANIGQ